MGGGGARPIPVPHHHGRPPSYHDHARPSCAPLLDTTAPRACSTNTNTNTTRTTTTMESAHLTHAHDHARSAATATRTNSVATAGQQHDLAAAAGHTAPQDPHTPER